MKEPRLKEKIAIIKHATEKKVFKPTYFDFYETDAPTLVYAFYVSTNENLNYFSNFTDFKGKTVLVPTSSGDHALNAIFFGAKSVETFDINSLAKFQYDLKETAARQLSRNEFIRLFTSNNILEEKAFGKIKPFLKCETRAFFTDIATFLKSKRKNQNFLFAEEPPHRGVFIRSNPYLQSEHAFHKLQANLRKLSKPVTHTLCAAHEIGEFFEHKDIIILSNIPSAYYGFGQPMKPLIKSATKILAKNGALSLNYVYGCLSKFEKFLLCKKIKTHLHIKTQYIENQTDKQKDFVMLCKDRG